MLSVNGKGEKLTQADGNSQQPTELKEMLARLGNHVRQFRARRGMSRKVLAQLSGVSERYLAQLEGGQANVTFNILCLLAQTMDTDIIPLLEGSTDGNPDLVLAKRLLENLSFERQSAAYQFLRNHFANGNPAGGGQVALIGLRGAGKTTLGERLARHFDVPFFRVTHMLEEMSGLDMAEIIMTIGQRGYRRLEHNALQETLAEHPRAVIETGGSIVSELRTFELLLRSCRTVWIKATPKEHMERVARQGDTRPMEGHMQRAMDDLRAILDSRAALYSRADNVLDTSGRSVDDCVNELVAICAPVLAEPVPATP